jgi:adenylate cyclase, class 2
MSADREVEIKFQIDDMDVLKARLAEAGFSVLTPPTHEFNTLYDQAGGKLRRRGALLRLRKFGEKWTLTYKDKSGAKGGRHKSRREIETALENGEAAARIFESLGFRPSFCYEKFRSEWKDSTGHVVLDETPIGTYGEIEGPPQWIDATARLLHIEPAQYITLSYAELFAAWKRKTKSRAAEMTFAAVKSVR